MNAANGIRGELLAVGTAAVLAAGVLAAGAAGRSQWSPHEVAETLDAFAQSRFLQDEGRFGMSRMARIVGHGNVMPYGETPREKEQLQQVDAARYPYIVAFLHITHPPAAQTRPSAVAAMTKAGASRSLPLLQMLWLRAPEFEAPVTPEKRADPAAIEREARDRYTAQRDFVAKLQATASHALSQLRDGRPVDAMAEGGAWQVAMRPVQATQERCLGCHTGAKRGDTLGVMVYAVRRTPAAAATWGATYRL